MRLPESAHTSRPWLIHELAHDFALDDVWSLPTPGGPGDFPLLVEAARTLDPQRTRSPLVRGLWALRWALGDLLGLDEPAGGLGARVPSLRERLPPELRDAPAGPASRTLPFTPLYLLDDEFALEIANRTVHGVLHLGWVRDPYGTHRGQLAVLVRRNGLLGAAYMAAITPFRHLVVYPALMRDIALEWRTVTAARQRPSAATSQPAAVAPAR